MERRKFIQKSVVATTALTAGLTTAHALAADKTKELYELRVYELSWNKNALEDYFSKALIPALNKMGIKNVGVFREIGKSEPTKIYLLIPYGSCEDFVNVNAKLKADTNYQQASEAYAQIPSDQKAYARYESSLMIAFDGMPRLVVPQNSTRLFELRTYESYSDDALRRKIKMFNESEFAIFSRVKLNSVFFGEVIAGNHMPCLTYMITFKNMEELDASWKAFGSDSEWQKISKAPEYADSVSRIHKVLLEPLSISQI